MDLLLHEVVIELVDETFHQCVVVDIHVHESSLELVLLVSGCEVLSFHSQRHSILLLVKLTQIIVQFIKFHLLLLIILTLLVFVMSTHVTLELTNFSEAAYLSCLINGCLCKQI